MSTLAVTTAHTLVLTVSHGLLFRQPLDYLCNGRFCRRFLSSFTALPVLRLKTPKISPSQSSVSTELLWLNVVVVTTSTKPTGGGSLPAAFKALPARSQTHRIHKHYDLSTI